MVDAPTYNKSLCFDPFPFPDASDAQKGSIGAIGERLDEHRKSRQTQHPSLAMTEMYNVLSCLRSATPLSPKEKAIHEQGLVSVLRQLHDQLDATVLEAYGLAPAASDQDIIERLVALNADRTAEECNGSVRWLRAEFQSASGTSAQIGFVGTVPVEKETQQHPVAQPWPKELPDRIAAVRAALKAQRAAISTEQVREAFTRAPKKDVVMALDMLATLGLILRFESSDGTRWKAAA